MKRNLFLLIVIAAIMQNAARAQLKIMPGAAVKTTNGGHVVLNNINLINDGNIQQAVNSGVFDFRGTSTDSISGTGTTVFDRINLSKSPGGQLVLQRNISVNSEFIFTGGVLYLDNYVLDLDGTGVLINENESNRAFTFGTGYIQATRTLNNPSSVNVGNLGAIISSTKNLGTTVIRRGHQVQLNIYASNNSILRYYDITPTNNTSLKATIRFNYFDAELNGLSEASITLWKKKDPVLWDYVGHDIRDATANYFVRNNVSKFSRWTLAIDTASTIVRVVQSIRNKEIAIFNHFVIRAFPNPTSSFFNITIQSPNQMEKIQLKIVTVTGQLIETRNVNSGELVRLGDSYRAGTYLIEAVQGSQRKTIKLVKLSD